MLRRPKILAALAAVALPAALVGVSMGGPPAEASPLSGASAPTAPSGGGATRARPPLPTAAAATAYSAAAAKYGVPESVLLAVSYAESRWDDHAGAPSTSGG